MRILCTILFLVASSAAFALQDTTRQFKGKLTKADSSSLYINSKIDSFQSTVHSLSNPELSLNSIARKRKINKRKEKKDSIQFYKKLEKQKNQIQLKINRASSKHVSAEAYIHQLDSLNKVTYQRGVTHSDTRKQKVISRKEKLTHQSDSLKQLASTNRYKAKLDSLVGLQRIEGTVNNTESKVSNAEQKINAPVDRVEGTVNEKLALMNKEGGAGANVPTGLNLPDASANVNVDLVKPDLNTNDQIGKMDNPINDQLSGVNEAKGKIGEVKAIPQAQIGKVKSIEEVKDAQGKIGEANAITDKAQAYGNDARNIASGNLNELKEAPKALEGKLAEAGGLQEIQKEAGAFDQYTDLTAKSDPAAMKQLALEQAMASFKPPVNHFAGQEEELQKAMNNMSKLKGKYTDLNSLKDVPKRKPNAMKGKPFIDRIVPGITLQVQKSNDVLIDYSPYVGYRIFGKLTAGAGWNERFNVGKHFHFSLKDRIYGPRAYLDFKFWKGFSVRTDVEKMNTYIPSIASGINDYDHRAWVWSAFIGLRKEYKFWGSVKGNAQFLYNLYDDHDNSPYGDRLIVRIGFEFPMKKKAKTESLTLVK